MVNRNIHLFLIPTPFCTFLLLDFCPCESSSCLSFWIFIQAPLSIVSFCVRDTFAFQLTDGEELWQFCTHMIQYFVLIHITFLRVFDSYFPFRFQFSAWGPLNIIYCLPCLLSMGLLLSPTKMFLNVRWMEPRNSILYLLIVS